MCARAVFICRPNSHPFQDRNVSLEPSIKIGRSVARARPSINNAIFDCKVLSRNHALLWYESGKFYLQDTKSSNGTFVNNQRLSKSSEESVPREVCSGDIVQFGVDVVEADKKVTHGCIVATLELYLPDGKEAKSSIPTFLSEKGANTSIQEMYQLNQYVKDAMQREKILEHKLAKICRLLCSTKSSLDMNWKTLIEEDRLLTHIEILERQIQASQKSMSEDKLREEVLSLQEDKEKYQNAAKEALQAAIQEKMDLLAKQALLERTLEHSQEERALLEERCAQSFQEICELSHKLQERETESSKKLQELNESSCKYKEDAESLSAKLKISENLLAEKQSVIKNLMDQSDEDLNSSMKLKVDEVDDIILPKPNNLNIEMKKENVASEMSSSVFPDNKSEDEDVNKNVWDADETLHFQLRRPSLENKDIKSILTHVLNILDDLKSDKKMSDPFVTSIENLCSEVKRTKNFIANEDVLKNIRNVQDEVNSESDNHLGNHKNETGNALDGEALKTVNALIADKVALEMELEELRKKNKESAIENNAVNLQTITKLNADLQARVDKLEVQLETSQAENSDLLHLINGQKETVKLLEDDKKSLEDKISALNSSVKNSENYITSLKAQINDLTPTKDTHHTGCQTSNSTSPPRGNSSIPRGNGSPIIGQDAKDPIANVSDPNLIEKLLEAEEELAIYKTRYNEVSSDCVSLTRKLKELSLERENNPKLVQMRYLIPVAILILAVLIALHPLS